MGWLSPDSKFMRALSDITDAVWVNILMLVTSIPLVTAGAALAAGHDAVRRSLIGEGHVTSNYFRAFKANFGRATLYWLIFGLTGAGLACSWIFLQIPPLLIPKFAFTIVWFIGFEWIWPLQARFSNTFGTTLKNAFIFGVGYAGTTIALVCIDVLFAVLFAASCVYMPKGVFLLVVLGYGVVLLFHIPLLERVFRKYMK